MATSMKFREIFFNNHIPFNVFEFSYEDFINCPKKEYLKVASSLNINLLKSNHQNNMLIDKIIKETSAKTQFSGKTKYKSNTLREAGIRTYRDYQLDDRVIIWMDKVYEVLNFKNYVPKC